MNLAAIVGAAVALVDGQARILDLVWCPTRARGGRACCYVRTWAGWTLLYAVVGQRDLACSRRTSPFPEEDYGGAGSLRSKGTRPPA